MRPLVILSLVLLPALAHADVVGPDPTDCPTGTRGTSCHGMEYCAPRTCTASSDCSTGEICQARDLCVTSGSCGGLRGPDAGPPPSVSVVTAECGSSCAEGTCESRMVCVPEGTPAGTGGGCGCHVSSREAPWLGLGFALLVGVAFTLRRR